MGKMTWFTIKALENTLQKIEGLKDWKNNKNGRLQYANIQQRSQKILRCCTYFFRGLTVLASNRPVFPRSKMTVFQTYNKSTGLKV